MMQARANERKRTAANALVPVVSNMGKQKARVFSDPRVFNGRSCDLHQVMTWVVAEFNAGNASNTDSSNSASNASNTDSSNSASNASNAMRPSTRNGMRLESEGSTHELYLSGKYLFTFEAHARLSGPRLALLVQAIVTTASAVQAGVTKQTDAAEDLMAMYAALRNGDPGCDTSADADLNANVPKLNSLQRLAQEALKGQRCTHLLGAVLSRAQEHLRILQGAGADLTLKVETHKAKYTLDSLAHATDDWLQFCEVDQVIKPYQQEIHALLTSAVGHDFVDSTEDNRPHIMYNFVFVINKLLRSPVIMKLSGLKPEDMVYITDMAKPVRNTASAKETMVTLWKGVALGTTPDSQSRMLRQLILWLMYFDVHDVLSADNSDPAMHFIHDTDHAMFEKITDAFKRESNSSSKNSDQAAAKRRHIFSSRLAALITQATPGYESATNSGWRANSALSFRLVVRMLELIPRLHILSNFVKLVTSMESRSGGLSEELDHVLGTYHMDSVLTYVRVRVDQDHNDSWNQRYRVRMDGAQKRMYVDYTNTPLPLYSNDQGRTPIRDNLKVIMTANASKYDNPSYFQPGANIPDEDLTYPARYLVGPFTRIFTADRTNAQIGGDMKDIVDVLCGSEPAPVLLVGYGASGAGKTSALIYFNKGKGDERDGIVVHLCQKVVQKLMAGQAQSRVGTGHVAVSLSVQELYSDAAAAGADKTTDPASTTPRKVVQDRAFVFKDGTFQLSEAYTHSNFHAERVKMLNSQDLIPSTMIKHAPDGRQSTLAQGTPLGEAIVHFIDTDRFVKATTNNVNSSRSHALVFLRFDVQGANASVNSRRTLIVGDFAGVENEFKCHDDEVIHQFQQRKESVASGKEQDARMFYSKYPIHIGGGSMQEDNQAAVEKTITVVEGLNYSARFSVDQKDYVGIQNRIWHPWTQVGFDVVVRDDPPHYALNKLLTYLRNLLKKGTIQKDTNVNYKDESYLNEWKLILSDAFRTDNDDSEGNARTSASPVIALVSSGDTGMIPGRVTGARLRLNEIMDERLDLNLIKKGQAGGKELMGELMHIVDKADNSAGNAGNNAGNVDNVDKSAIREEIERLTSGELKEAQDFLNDSAKINAAARVLVNLARINAISTFNIENWNAISDIDSSGYRTTQGYLPGFTSWLSDQRNDDNSTFSSTPAKSVLLMNKLKASDVSMGDTFAALSERVARVLKARSVDLSVIQKPFNAPTTSKDVYMTYYRTLSKDVQTMLGIKMPVGDFKEAGRWVEKFRVDAFLQQLSDHKSTLRKNENALTELETLQEINGMKGREYGGRLFDELNKVNSKLAERMNPGNKNTNAVVNLVKQHKVFADFQNRESTQDVVKLMAQAAKHLGTKVGMANTSTEAYHRAFNYTVHMLLDYRFRHAYVREACELRLIDGKYINSSLTELRDVIRYLLVLKNAGRINPIPSFIDPCLSQYTGDNGSFGSLSDGASSGRLASSLFGVIRDYLDSSATGFDDLKNIVISFLTVLNLSRTANNPPNPPYVDANRFKQEVRSLHFRPVDTVIDAKEAKGLKDANDKLVSLLGGAGWGEWYAQIKMFAGWGDVQTALSGDKLYVNTVLLRNLRSLCDQLDRFNAASAIGTLEFTDGIAKYGSVGTMCLDMDHKIAKSLGSSPWRIVTRPAINKV